METPTTTSADQITGPQLDYIRSLLLQKGAVPDGSTVDQVLRDRFAGMTKTQASRAIESLRGLPSVPKPRQNRKGAGRAPQVELEDGRYAIIEHHPDGPRPVFYRFKNGRVPGYYRLDHLVGQPGGDYAKYPVAPGSERFKRVIAEIAKDPRAAMTLFGQVSKTCSYCGSPLSDPVSLETGVGPQCRDKHGWTVGPQTMDLFSEEVA
jgi:hypothetical protein